MREFSDAGMKIVPISFRGAVVVGIGAGASALREAGTRTARFAAILAAASILSLVAATPGVANKAPEPASTDVQPAQASNSDGLAHAFRDPPDSARPRVWWHWLGGNVSSEGITKDLEWMHRVGLAGAMMFDGDLGSDQIVPRVTVLSPQWYAELQHASSEARRLGLEFAMAAAPGWSETGGPWVKPDMAMKKFIWSETRAVGGRPVGKLQPLPNIAGPFQDVPNANHFERVEIGAFDSRDVAVLAYRAPAGDVPLANLRPVITASGAGQDLAGLVDGALAKSLAVSPDADGTIWVRFAFDRPQTMRALTLAGPVRPGRIEASDDGREWRLLRALSGESHSGAPQRTLAFAPATARQFRVVFDGVAGATTAIGIAELALLPGARTDRFEDRAGFGIPRDADAIETPAVERKAAIAGRDIVDLTSRLRPDGTLDWTPPRGDWVILRTGYSLTGQVNHPATKEGTGLEVDKLNPRHVRAHLEAYIGPVLKQTANGSEQPGLQYLVTDSWEAGQANWTESMIAEFSKRRGYDAKPFLPVLAGRVVDSAARSDAFLWDFRRTIADLVAESHYGTISRFASDHGLGYYGEATGASWPTIADGMQAKSMTDIPMGEFWTMPFGGKPGNFLGIRSDAFPADIIETRSAAHVYGKSLVAAEALTSSQPQWISTPWNLKWVADKYMAMGVNRLILHTSPHQPVDKGPGLSLAPFGQAFTRLETWGEMARPWIDYLSRSSYLLQQGTPVADLLYFYGEGAPSGVPYDAPGVPADPTGYGFDYVNADALLRNARVSDGRITFPGGASYGVLLLPADLKRMTLPLITRLRELVEQGAVIAGPKPLASPSLSSSSEAVEKIADQLWGHDAPPGLMRDFGKGRVYWLTDAREVVDAERIVPDFGYSASDAGIKLEFNHRRLNDGELYFVTNQSARDGTATLRFRVTGKAAEMWRAEDGERRRLSYNMTDGITEVPVEIAPYQSFFILFRTPAKGNGETLASPQVRQLAQIDGTWSVDFPAPTPGTGTALRLQTGSWTQVEDPDIRYFSGTAVYRQSLKVESSWLTHGSQLFLELGRIGDIAEVEINGKSAGIAWLPPYRVDVSQLLHPGRNDIVIRVANTWQNRLVGDLQPDANRRAYTNSPVGIAARIAKPLRPDTPLTPSGLLEPVRLIAVLKNEAIID